MIVKQIKQLIALGVILGITNVGFANEPFPYDDTVINRSNTERLTSYAEVLTPARAAVVSVTSESIVKTIRRGGANPMDEFLRRLYGIPGPGQDRQQGQLEQEEEERRVPNGMGSGVIVSPDGYILTNNHVVVDEQGEAADEIVVRLNDDREFVATLVGRDPKTDIALLKIEGKAFPYITMTDSDHLEIGDIVFAIGNPLGVGQTTTMGIVSAVGRSHLGILGNQGYENFIQTDAAINRGNSGGALVDADGRLVGINSAIISPVGANIGIGFAIPTQIARTIASSLVEDGSVRRGFLGVSIRDLDKDLAEAFGLDGTDGVLVERVEDGLPAADGGIERGDVILGIAGAKIVDTAALRFRIASITPGTTVALDIYRDGERKSIEVKLADAENPSVVAKVGGAGNSLFEGVILMPVTADMVREWGLISADGLLVTEVEARSIYANILSKGMQVLEINGKDIHSIADAETALRKGGVNRLWVAYKGNTGYLALRIP